MTQENITNVKKGMSKGVTISLVALGVILGVLLQAYFQFFPKDNQISELQLQIEKLQLEMEIKKKDFQLEQNQSKVNSYPSQTAELQTSTEDDQGQIQVQEVKLTAPSSGNPRDLLQEKGYDFDYQNFTNAIKKGDYAACKLFIRAGMSVDGNSDSSPLKLAAGNGYLNITNLLLSNGADVHRRINGTSPLIEASLNAKASIVDILIQKGANIDANSKIVGDCIKRMHSSETSEATRGNYLKCIKSLLKIGANPNHNINFSHKDFKEAFASPLIVAMLYDNKPLFNLLIKNGADASAKTSYKFDQFSSHFRKMKHDNILPANALDYAFSIYDTEFISKLLSSYKFDVNQNEWSTTHYLCTAIQENDLEMVKRLIKLGSNKGPCYNSRMDNAIREYLKTQF